MPSQNYLFCLLLIAGMLMQVAQAVLVPLLVNKEKIGPSSLKAIKSMMVMEPPLDFQVRCRFYQ